MKNVDPDYVQKPRWKSARLNGICCKTRREAEFVRRQRETYLELIDLIRELNDGWRPDWNNYEEVKWEPIYYYNPDVNQIKFSATEDQSLPDYFQRRSKFA